MSWFIKQIEHIFSTEFVLQPPASFVDGFSTEERRRDVRYGKEKSNLNEKEIKLK